MRGANKPGPDHKIDKHPKRQEIRNAIIKGVPFPRIKEKYGISLAGLQRYVKSHLSEEIAKALIDRDKLDQEYVVKQIQDVLDRLWKYATAVDAELADPSDPDKYFLGPRAGEVEVIYLYKDPKDKTETPPRKGKAKLQDLLNRISKNGYHAAVTDVKYADPRELHIKNANAITKATDSLARLLGLVKEIKINVTRTEEWTIIKQTIIEATKESPEVRGQIVAALKRISDGVTHST